MIFGQLVDQHVEIKLNMIGELGFRWEVGCLLWLLSWNYRLNRAGAIC